MPHKSQDKRSTSESTDEAGSQSGGSNGRLANLEKRWGDTRRRAITFQAREVVCVRTNGRQMFVPVSFKRFAGEDCALINSGGKVTWLARVLHKQQRDEYDTSLVVRAFDTEVRARLKQNAGMPDSSIPVSQSATQEPKSGKKTQGPKRGKQNVMSDSEESAGSPDGLVDTKTYQVRSQMGRRKRRRLGTPGFTIDAVGWTKVPVEEGFCLTLGVARNQPGLLTPLHVKNVTDAVTYLDKNYSRLLAIGRGLHATQLGQLEEMGAPAPSAVGVPVRYNIAHDSYLIVYQDNNGKLVKSEKGLHCPRVRNGVHLSPEVYADVKKTKLAHARAMWNALDHSGAPRLDTPD